MNNISDHPTAMKNTIKDGILVIVPEGNLLSEETKKPVMELLRQNLDAGVNKVLFDLTGLKYMNSAGLDMLLISVAKIKHAGGESALCNIPEQTKKLFSITKLGNFFNEQPDELSGISYLKSVKQK